MSSETIQKLRGIFVAIVLVVAPLMSLAVPGVAHASGGGTFTWNGDSGLGGNWSTPDNWAGGVAPQSGDVGDTIIIDNSANFNSDSIDNISTLSLTSLQFENNSSGFTPNTVRLEDPLTITGNITQEPSDTGTLDTIANNGTAETLTIGAHVSIIDPAGLTLGSGVNPDTIALGGNTLTFTDTGSGSTEDIYDNITGSGTINYNGSSTDYNLFGDNTYSGATNVNVTSNPITTNNDDAFGTSTLTIGANSEVSFDYDTTTTLTNPIILTGTGSGTPATSLDFETLGTGVTIAVPNITLNGETALSNGGTSSTLTVNLAGITTNGYCVDYIGYGGTATDGPSNGFINGPMVCAPSSSSGGGSSSSSGSSGGSTTTNTPAAPKAPDTGLAAVRANPLVTVLVTVMTVATLLIIIRQLRQSSDYGPH